MLGNRLENHQAALPANSVLVFLLSRLGMVAKELNGAGHQSARRCVGENGVSGMLEKLGSGHEMKHAPVLQRRELLSRNAGQVID
jgi:hypothetical protein